MSKPLFQDLFKFSGRRNRQSYIILTLIQIGAIFALSFLTVLGVVLLDSFSPLGYLLLAGCAVAFVGIIVSAWACSSQRIRDFGHSGVWILLCLIPYIGWIVSLAICFIPSNPGTNKYGSSCIE